MNFLECFGRSAPQYFVSMDESVKRVSASDDFHSSVTSLFQKTRIMCVSCGVTECHKKKDDVAKALRGLLAKKSDAYAFWLLCHDIAACPRYFEQIPIDEELYELYKRNIDFANESGETLLPSPPQMTVQCFQQAVCAVLVTLVRSTAASEGEVELYTVDTLSVMERVIGEVCGTWFESGGDASSGGRSVSAMFTTPCVELYDHITADNDLSGARVGVTVHPLVQRTFDAALFIARSLFVCMSSSQSIRRGDPCDCKPIGYNTLRGAHKLAEVGDSRFYKSDACDRMIQLYSHMWRGVHHIFGSEEEDHTVTHGLCQNSEDLFNACVARHGRPGNLHVSGDAVNITSMPDTLSATLKRLDNLLDEWNPDDNESYKLELCMSATYEPIKGDTFFARFVRMLTTTSRSGADYYEDDNLNDDFASMLENDLKEILDAADFELYRNIVSLDSDDALKKMIVTYITSIGASNLLTRFFLKLMLMMRFSYLYATTGVLYRTTADTEGAKTLSYAIYSKICSEERPTKDDLRNMMCTHLRMSDDFKCVVTKASEMHGGCVARLHHDTIVFVLASESGSSRTLHPGERAKQIRTAFKAPVTLPRSDRVFTRSACEEEHVGRKHRMTSFLLYLKRYRQNNPSKDAYTCDQVYDDWCRLLGSSGRADGEELDDGGPMRAPRAPFVEGADDQMDVAFMVSDRKYDRIAKAMEVFEGRSHGLLVYILLCTQPVNKGFLRRLIRNDVMFPFGYLLLRPYQTYEMCTAVLTKSGAETGETLIGHYDFQLSDNVIQKMHYGNFTVYLKSVVYRPVNVHLAWDIMCANYLGGGGSEFRTSDSDKDETMRTDEDRVPSLYSCLIGFDERIKDNPLDVTGRFAPHTCLNNIRTPHYSTAEAYGAQHAFYPMTPPNGDLPYFDSENRGNTICFQGHQASYNHNTGYIDRVTLNTGHWGERVYPGCGKVRRGLSKFLEPVNYSNARVGGGGAVSTGFGVVT
ncbi:hypothetical protein CYMTET_15518 [Cymbomonas tetramitiformis]|uniref:Uncharacterized protein n=1 Tax=Cymbomonas tetramitiformis TaxID=36881 RepID=A0AAE0L8U0_9CHLO|nr:hypothetical protein CYMTET_15518 [Cymbomonas tetramitiformis]